MLIFNSLRKKLILSMLGIGLIPLAIVGLIGYYVSYNGFIQQATKQVGDLPKQAGERIESLLYYRYTDIRNFAALPMVLEKEWDLLDIYCSRVVEIYESYGWLGVLDAEGVIRSASVAAHKGVSQAGEKWFGRVLQGEKLVIEDVRSTGLVSEPVITFTIPIYGRSGKLEGAVHSEIKAAQVLSLVEAIKTDPNGIVVLANRQGKPLGEGSQSMISSAGGLNSLLAFKSALSGQEGVTRENFAGREMLLGYLPLRGYGPYPGLGWILMVMVDAEEVFAPARAQARVVLLIMLLTAAVISLIALLLARSIFRPLQNLGQAAREIAAGNHQVSLPAQTKDVEMLQLQEALQVMLTSLLAKQSLLEETNLESQHKQLELNKVNEELARNIKTTNEFLGNISHELITPVSAILAFAEMVLLEEVGGLNPKQKEYLEEVMDSSRELQQLINDLLDLYRLESSKLRLKLEPIAIQEVFLEVKPLLEPLALKGGIAIRFSASNDLPLIMADRVRLKQILLNLASNALKFTPPAGEVKLEASWSGNCPGEVLLKVVDNGIGISPEEQVKIFAKFYQVDSSRTRSYGGAGLGLALTKQLVDLHQGQIWVESVCGQGSSFFVSLSMEKLEKQSIRMSQTNLQLVK